jgi:hypothetical protein
MKVKNETGPGDSHSQPERKAFNLFESAFFGNNVRVTLCNQFGDRVVKANKD